MSALARIGSMREKRRNAEMTSAGLELLVALT